MRRARRRVSIAFFIAVLALAWLRPHVARADDKERVTELLELIQSKPSGMDEIEWKEKRRDAVKELGGYQDPRIGPAMVKVIETENFDIIAEHAVNVIGKLEYEAAVPTLQRIVSDNSRDRDIRRAARRALKRMGASAEGGGGNNGGGGGGGGSGGGNGGGGAGLTSGIGGGRSIGNTDVELPEGPTFPEDTLGATDRLTFALGGARLEYNTVDKQPSLDGDVSASYEHTLDRQKMAYNYGGDASVVAGYVDFEGAGVSSRALIANASVHGGARLYFGEAPVYGLGQAFTGFSLNHIKVNRQNDADNVDQTLSGADLGLVIGAGYGRILDRGAELRVRRIETALKESQALGRKITPDLAEKLFEAWWALRGRPGSHDQLVATVTILRESGVLLGEPDAATTYKILQVLEDGQLDHRREGVDVHFGIGETLLYRDDDFTAAGVEDGRIESVLLASTYGWQSQDGTHEIIGEGFGRLRILAEDGEASPYALVATAAWRKYFYGDNFDPIGALEFAGQAGLSDPGIMDQTNRAGLVGGSIGWIWSPNRASWFRIAGSLTFESNELFLGVTAEASYGLLDVGFIGKGAYDK